MIAAAIMDGSYPEGKMIPSIRNISTEYKINPITVSKAFQSLVDEGVLEKKRGLGMCVTDGAQQLLLSNEKQTFLESEWPRIKDKIKRLGLDIEELIK